MGTLWQDLRLSLRMLGKNPGFTAIALLTLSLGIGANTAIFHLIDAVLLRSLPIKNPQSLAAVQIKGGNHGFGVNAGDETFLTYPLWEQLREEAPPPECYAPASQFPAVGPESTVLIRSSAPLSQVTAAVRQKIGSVSPGVSLEFAVLQTYIQDQLIPEPGLAMLSGAFGFLAALLAMIGLYGVISYIVVPRRSEIGIRMALGASRQTIAHSVLGQTVTLLAAGIAIGVVGATALTRAASAILFGVRPVHFPTLLSAGALLAAVAVMASLIPARRAASIDPLVALRYE